MNSDLKIRNPDLAKIVKDAKEVDADLILKVILIVDNAMNTQQRNMVNDNAQMTKRVIGVEESVNHLRAELTNERESRAKTELEIAQRSVDAAKARLQLTTDAKIELKKIVDNSITQQLDTVLDDKEEDKREEWRKWWRDTWQAFLRALFIGVGITISLGLFALAIRFLANVFKVPIGAP